MGEPVSFKYHAFLSYSHRDKAWADWLHRALEAYRIDNDLVGRQTAAGLVPKTLRPIFRDRDDFSAGHSLNEQTLAALEGSKFLIALCSPNSAKSKYVNEEIRCFNAIGRGARVIAMIVDGKPGDSERECFPPALRFKFGADGTLTDVQEHPIAADARAEGDGKQMALQKVVSALIGVPFDDVRKRDAIADNRRIKIGAAGIGVFAVVVLFAGFFFYQHQRQLAREAATTAELRARDETREKQLADMKALVERLLFVSQAQGAMEPGALQAVGDAVAAAVTGVSEGDPRFAKALELFKAGKPTEAEPLFRAVAEEKERAAATINKEAAAAYRNLGAIAGLGDPKRAREAYGRAVMLDHEDREALYWHAYLQFDAGDLGLVERDLNRLLELSLAASDQRGIYRAHMRSGELLVARGNLAAAREREERAIAIALEQSRARPGDLEWQRDLSVAYVKIGDVQAAQGDLQEALQSFRDSLAIAQRLAKADSSNASWQRDLSISYNKIGDVEVKQGNLQAALKSYRDSLAIRKHFANAAPNNAGRQRDLSLSYNKVGEVQVAQGNLPDALQSFRDSLAIRERLATADPGSAGRQRDLWMSYDKVGWVQQAQDSLPDALQSFRDSLAIVERLARADPGNASWQHDMSVSYGRVGEVLDKQGALSAALTEFRKGHAIMEKLTKVAPDYAEWQRDLKWFKDRIAKLDEGTK